MAKKEMWYNKEIITPWRARKSMGAVIVTQDPKREQEVEDMMMIDMAVRELLENARVVLQGRKNIPTHVDYYMMDVINAAQTMLRKYTLYLDETELDALAHDTEVMKRLEKGGVREIAKLYKEGRFDIYVEGLSPKGDMRVITVKLRDLQKRKGSRQMIDPVPMVVNKRNLVTAENIEAITPVPMNFLFNHLLKKYTLDPPNKTTFTFIKGLKFGVDDRDLNERPVYLTLLKNLAKHPAVIRRGGAIVLSTPSLGLVPLSLRNYILISHKELPTREEIVQQLTSATNLLKKRGFVPKDTKVTEELVEASLGLNLDEIHTTLSTSAYLYREIRVDMFRDKKIEKLENMGVRYVEPKTTLEDVGGMKAVKKGIQERIIHFAKHPEIAEKYNIPPPRGFLLAGIGGTGKTWLGKALAGELGRPVIMLNAADFMSKYVGESEQNLRNILQIANDLNAVVFIDEIDAIAMRRESIGMGDSGVSRRVVNMLMEFLGDRDRKAMVIGATNLIQSMDVNFLRAGRFDQIFHVSPPDYEGRVEILKIHAQKLNPPSKEVTYEKGVFEKIAKETPLWTGAELEKLVVEAKIVASEKNSNVMGYKHFKEAMRGIQINIEERKEEIKKQLKALEELPQGAVSRDTLTEGWNSIRGGKEVQYSTGAEEENVLETQAEEFDITPDEPPEEGAEEEEEEPELPEEEDEYEL